jgi:hypothetical protein
VAVPDAAPAAPPAPVAAPAPVKYSAYEYVCTEFSAGNATDVLNEAGSRGWELTAFTKVSKQDLACFRRPRAGAARRVP